MTEEQISARLRLYAKAGKRSATLHSVEVEDVRFLKFKTIVAIKDAMARADARTEFDVLTAVFQNFGKEYKPLPNTEKQTVEFIFFIIDGVKGIANMEASSFEPESADVDTSGLDRFKEINIVDSLAGGDILKWEQIQELPYFDVFIKMLMIQEKNKIEKARNQKHATP